MTNPAAWHPDPTRRHELRYWDGNAWTAHVSDRGQQGTDPVTEQGNIADSIDRTLSVGRPMTPEDVQRAVQDTGMRGAGITPSGPGGGTLFTEQVLVVSQKAKLLEVTAQYSVFDQNGRAIGFVNQIGQSALRKAVRVLTNVDQFLTHRLQITDATGTAVMQLTRPGKIFKSTVIVGDGAGNEIGRIVQENMVGKIHFALQAGGQTVGSIKAENWRAWNFRIEDHTGVEVARITKTWEGALKTMFTTADNYVVQIHTQLAQPLLSLVVAAALSVDTALKQDSRGLG
jgi:uncharacterized protein YxjI